MGRAAMRDGLRMLDVEFPPLGSNSSEYNAIELPDIRRYHEQYGQDKVFMLFNLQLETLRADLELIGFPPRSLHIEFFTRFRSIFFLRNRQYSKSVNVPPFLINYSGALFREYPGPWQVMLRQDDGSLVCVAE